MALAGFASVVVAFRSGALHEWAPIDKLRLRLLLGNSVVPLLACLVAMLLLSVKPPPPWIWRACSGLSVAFGVLFGYSTMKGMHPIRSRELGMAGRWRLLFYGMGFYSRAAQRFSRFTTLWSSMRFGRSSRRSSCSLSPASSSSFGSFFCRCIKPEVVCILAVNPETLRSHERQARFVLRVTRNKLENRKSNERLLSPVMADFRSLDHQSFL